MVLGLGTVLPARPARRQPPQSGRPPAGSQLARVQSNSLAEGPQQAIGVPDDVAASGWPVGKLPAGGSKSQADAVGTPTSHAQLPQPASSDQSNVKSPRGGLLPLPEPREQRRQQPATQVQQQEPPAQPSQQPQPQQGRTLVAPPPPAQDQRPEQEQQTAQEQQSAAQQQQRPPVSGKQPDAPQPAKVAVAARKRKSAAKPSATPEPSNVPLAPTRRSRLDRSADASQGRGRRRASETPAAADADSTPAGKRRRGSRAKVGAKHSPSKYADILHCTVVVPGKIFFVKDPKAVFIGRVNKLESGRKVPSVEVQFIDDPQKYWFPVADVREWIAGMVRSGSWAKHNPGVPPPAPPPPPGAPAAEDTQAAQALRSLSASRCTSGGDDTCSAAQPTASTGRQPGAEAAGQLQRSGSELKRVGALDIMVHAADL